MATDRQDDVRGLVREHYRQVAESGGAGCGCNPAGGETPVADARVLSRRIGYSASEVEQAPQAANMGLGCGNPQAIAALKAGDRVLDLGSGGGFDCFLAARQVGEGGRVIGVDMTPAMIDRARTAAVKGGYTNVEFRLGEIERLPLEDASVDVVLSNCVINLSPDKSRVFGEAFRVLKPGGRLAIADIVATGELPESVRRDLALYTGCIAGAAAVADVESMLRENGFTGVRVTPNLASKAFLRDWASAPGIADVLVSATIEATRPAA